GSGRWRRPARPWPRGWIRAGRRCWRCPCACRSTRSPRSRGRGWIRPSRPRPCARPRSGRAPPSTTPRPGWHPGRGRRRAGARPASPVAAAGRGCRLRSRARQRCSMAYPDAMRGKDEDTGEFLSPSRSQQRREALDVLALADTLTELEPGRLAKLPVPEHLLPHIAEARRITSHIAHKRQLAFLAKQMRREDDEVLDAIRDAL